MYVKKRSQAEIPSLTHHSLIIKDFIAVRYSMKVMC